MEAYEILFAPGVVLPRDNSLLSKGLNLRRILATDAKKDFDVLGKSSS